jgi:hypothetical protein
VDVREPVDVTLLLRVVVVVAVTLDVCVGLPVREVLGVVVREPVADTLLLPLLLAVEVTLED